MEQQIGPFPENFIWGAASSAYQTEGSPTADGGGRSVWDEFCSHEGNIYENGSGETACDAYHRYGEDLDLAAALGLQAYRLSVSWARVDPLGDGNWNRAGLDYYDRLIDGCLERGIEPYVTLHHWELPQAVEERGGWLDRRTAEAFARYEGMCAGHFGSRVKNYFTINEPQIILKLGYHDGIHAPGKKLPDEKCFAVWKNLLIAHGLAFRAVKDAAPHARVGIASTGNLCYSTTGKEADRAAAEKAMFSMNEPFWMFSHTAFLDPVFFGTAERFEGPMADVLAEQLNADELKLIHAVPDLLGINAYNGWEVRAGENGEPVYVPREPGHPVTALKWPITPEILNNSLFSMQKRYQVPIMVTENGLSCNDRIFLDGKVHDPDRIDYLIRYLSELSKGAEEAGVTGYFHWSLTDNFEWHSGYGERFGLIYVDYPSQRRIPKDSAYWFRDFILEQQKRSIKE